MKKLLLMKTVLLLFALVVGSGSVWAEKVEKEETFSFSTGGCTGWSTDNAGSYCGGYGRNKNGDYYVANASISNFSSVNFSAVNTPSVTIYVKALTNGGVNEYTVSLIDKDGKVVGTPVTKTDGMGSGSNASSAKESSVILTPVSGTTGYRIDFPAKSAITQTKYTLTYDTAPAAPTFSPAAGDFSDDFELTISCATDGATIYYTTNGDTPTSSSTVYDPANKPTIPAGADVTVKAIAIKAGVSSTVSSATYTYKNIANPVFGPVDGSTVLYGESVAITCATDGAEIYYTQGSTPADPTSASTKYTSPIVLTEGTTIKAIAINGSDESDVVSATYTVKATAPTFSVVEGTYDATQNVTLSTTTNGATIYYTTDGSTPTSSSTEYTGAISISSSQTIKAIAIKSGLTDSDVSSATYTLKCATPTFSITEGLYDKAQSLELYSTDGASIYYTIKTDGTYPTNPTASSTEYTGAIPVTSSMIIKAIAIKDGLTNSDIAIAIYRIVVPASLPFNWAGGYKETLMEVQGVETSGLGSNYTNDSHNPYNIKFDDDNDYIQVRTNAPISAVSVGVKMIGGSKTSKIKVQGSVDGTNFTDVEDLTISGNSNDIRNLATTGAFSTSYRWVRLSFVKGSNVGVGPISITNAGPADPTVSDDVTYLTTSDNMDGWRAFYDASKNYSVDNNTKVYVADKNAVGTTITLKAIEGIPAGVPVILHTTSAADSHKMTLTKKPDGTYTYGGTNYLKVTTGGETIDAYRLGYNSTDGVAFYPYAVASAPAGVIYLELPSGARVLEMNLEDGDVTAIETVKSEKADGQYYNLAGQRVAQPTKGLYIVNGRKVVVK